MVFEILSGVLFLALIYVIYLYVNYRYQVNRIEDNTTVINSVQEIYRYVDMRSDEVTRYIDERCKLKGEV
jgi:aspartyl-tRNA synthetase